MFAYDEDNEDDMIGNNDNEQPDEEDEVEIVSPPSDHRPFLLQDLMSTIQPIQPMSVSHSRSSTLWMWVLPGVGLLLTVLALGIACLVLRVYVRRRMEQEAWQLVTVPRRTAVRPQGRGLPERGGLLGLPEEVTTATDDEPAH
ncbi:hypothetical protein Pcinc_025681 [Petrolisthes cinctipes]|uniref:Uncharacterized protein n=1 Tax=Petrolisthes cinctipes TaxID=88211 RepID=A0AAE1KB85_PETCI|nr:hypothetical protein Pcinc_025681 [Petrolisthes cinctipes]